MTIPGEEERAPVDVRAIVRAHNHNPRPGATFNGGEGGAVAACLAYAAALSHQSPSRAAGEGVPAGMVAWHGGDSAPEDWDGGPCLLRSGEHHTPDAIDPGNDWSHDPQWGSAENDIIAYTPKSTPQTVTGNDELTGREGLEAILRVVQRSTGDQAISDAADTIAALATPAELPGLPSREEIARIVGAGIYGPSRSDTYRHVTLKIADAILALHPPASVAEVEGLREDAERWRALWSSARFKMIGSVNFDHSAYPEVSVKADRDPREWLHFGLEVWDRHPVQEGEPGWEQGVHGRNLLLAYVEHLRAATPLPSGESNPHPDNGEPR